MAGIEMFRCDAARAERYPAGRTVFAEGEPGETMYVVIEGEVELRVKGQTVERLGPGGMLGEMSLVDAAPRSATAVAGTEAKLVPVDRRRFSSMIRTRPSFAIEIMRVMADRLRRMDARL